MIIPNIKINDPFINKQYSNNYPQPTFQQQCQNPRHSHIICYNLPVNMKKLYYICMHFLKNLIEQLCCSEKIDFYNQEMDIKRKYLKQGAGAKHDHHRHHKGKGSKKIQAMKHYINELPEQQKGEKVSLSLMVPDKKVLFLDLDKTIIYYNEQENGFVMRPHLKYFLKSLEKHYSIYIFTAATSRYLQQMLLYIQQNQGGVQYFSGYLTRQNCLQIRKNDNKSYFIKDIRVAVNCEIEKTVVVDDTPICYCLNPDNAVPIPPFQGKTPDNQLLYLVKTLIEIKDYNDVREYIRERYIFSSVSSLNNSFSSAQSTIDSFCPKKQPISIPIAVESPL